MKAGPLTKKLAERGVLDAKLRQSEAAGSSSVSAFRRLDLDELDRRIREEYGSIDVAFRAILAANESLALEYPIEQRALGATARGLVGDNDLGFGAAFWTAAVAAAPLLNFCTTAFTGPTGEPFTLGYIATNPSSNGIVADGATISDTDATFGGRPLGAYAYKQLLRVSAEMVDDGLFDVVGYAADVLGRLSIRDFADDLIAGDGSGKPLGLVGQVTTVNAAGASAVVLDDIGNLLENVPAAYAFGGRCAILISPGAYWDLRRQTLGTGSAGGMAVDASLPYVGGTLLGFPFAVETGLAAPASAAVSVLAGDFASGYGVRIAPLRVESDTRGTINTDRVLVRCVLRGDGAPLVTDAVRALVGP